VHRTVYPAARFRCSQRVCGCACCSVPGGSLASAAVVPQLFRCYELYVQHALTVARQARQVQNGGWSAPSPSVNRGQESEPAAASVTVDGSEGSEEIAKLRKEHSLQALRLSSLQSESSRCSHCTSAGLATCAESLGTLRLIKLARAVYAPD
jgi:hypothetical protein